MIYYYLGERQCPSCAETLDELNETSDQKLDETCDQEQDETSDPSMELYLEVAYAIPPDYTKIKYVCPHCSDEIEDTVGLHATEVKKIPEDAVVAVTEWKGPH